MAGVTDAPILTGVRKRKTHRKSRRGCSNCKLRRVKCDEAKPKCLKCIDYGVDCSYDAKPEGNLQLSVAGAFMLDVPQALSFNAPSADQTNLEMINTSMARKYTDLPFRPYRLTMTDLGILKRFQTRTVVTIGTADTYEAYRDEVVRLASYNPFLMHILLTLTLVHDRYLAKGTKLSVAEAFHWYQGTALFNYILTKPIKPDERDAVWASAALLGAVSFSSSEVTRPEEAWPLRPRADNDLDWLQMSNGKKEIARLAYPDGPDSVFYKPHKLAAFTAVGKTPAPGCKFESFDEDFTSFFELDDSSSVDNNPYYKAATKLNDLFPFQVNHKTILSFFQYIGHTQPEYKILLKEKDPRAMLLLAYWYAKLCEYKQWWVFTRAFVECQSICIYLKRYHWHNPKMWKLLKFPVSRCGLEGSDEMSNKHWIFPS